MFDQTKLGNETPQNEAPQFAADENEPQKEED